MRQNRQIGYSSRFLSVFRLRRVVPSVSGRKSWCPSGGLPKRRNGLREVKVKLLHGEKVLEVGKYSGDNGDEERPVLWGSRVRHC